MSSEQKIKNLRDVHTGSHKDGWSITRAQRSRTYTHNVQVNWQSLNQHCVCLMFAIKNNNFYSVEVCQLRRVKTIIKRICLTTANRVLHTASLGRNWHCMQQNIVHSFLWCLWCEVHWRRRWCWKWRNFLLSVFICKFFLMRAMNYARRAQQRTKWICFCCMERCDKVICMSTEDESKSRPLSTMSLRSLDKVCAWEREREAKRQIVEWRVEFLP